MKGKSRKGVSKGKSAKGGFARRESDFQSPASPQQLSDEKLLQIKALVQSMGGSTLLDAVLKAFPGVRKSQLEHEFQLTLFGQEWEIMLNPEDQFVDFGDFLLESEGLEALVLTEAVEEAHVKAEESNVSTGMVDRPERRPPVAQERLLRVAKTGALVPVLDSAKIDEITDILYAHDGVLPLGALSQKFPGLKRQQLEGHFDLSIVGDHGQWEVRLPGVDSQGAEMMFDGKAIATECILPPLTEEQIHVVEDAIMQAPTRSVTIQDLFQIVPGVKRKQLEEYFEVKKLEKKRFVISMKGLPTVVPTPTPTPKASPPINDPTFEPLSNAILSQVIDFLEDRDGFASLEEIYQAFHGVRKRQLEDHFNVDRDGNKFVISLRGWESVERSEPSQAKRPPHDSSEKPRYETYLPPLERAKIDEVAAFLRSQGGSSPLGRVTSTIRFVKRSQLEGHFILEPAAGDQWVVRLKSSSRGFGTKRPATQAFDPPPSRKGTGKGKGSPRTASRSPYGRSSPPSRPVPRYAPEVYKRPRR